MNQYQIISDSSCDLPESLRLSLSIDLVPYYVTFDQTIYLKENDEISIDDFYRRMAQEKELPKTSLPPIQDYIDCFEKHLKKGRDILCFCLSSKFSGSFQSANNAKNMLLEEYPDHRIAVIDSIQATGGQGLIVQEAALMQQAGFCLDTVVEKIELLKKTVHINFTVDSLEHLQKGGRIGKVSALAGSLLNIKPIIVMKEGELIPTNKVRGKKKAFQTILQMTLDEIGKESEKYRVCLITVDRDADLAVLQEELVKNGSFTIQDPFWKIGVTIGTHAGPTAIGICYIKKYDTL